MIVEALEKIGRDDRGGAPYRLIFGSCLLATAVATAAPGFEANPLLGKALGEMRHHLPATLETVRRGMGGN